MWGAGQVPSVMLILSVKGTLSTLEDEGGGHVEGHCA